MLITSRQLIPRANETEWRPINNPATIQPVSADNLIQQAPPVNPKRQERKQPSALGIKPPRHAKAAVLKCYVSRHFWPRGGGDI